jgi:hypothetical protein
MDSIIFMVVSGALSRLAARLRAVFCCSVSRVDWTQQSQLKFTRVAFTALSQGVPVDLVETQPEAAVFRDSTIDACAIVRHEI